MPKKNNTRKIKGGDKSKQTYKYKVIVKFDLEDNSAEDNTDDIMLWEDQKYVIESYVKKNLWKGFSDMFSPKNDINLSSVHMDFEWEDYGRLGLTNMISLNQKINNTRMKKILNTWFNSIFDNGVFGSSHLIVNSIVITEIPYIKVELLDSARQSVRHVRQSARRSTSRAASHSEQGSVELPMQNRVLMALPTADEM